MLMLAFLAALSADPQPGSFKLFGNWAVACDNLHRCEMTSVMPPDDATGDAAEDSDYVSAVREAGPAGGFTIELAPDDEPAKGMLSVRVDATTILTAPAAEVIQITGGDAARLIAAMASGKVLTLVDSAGKTVARTSLAGSAAALRHIDADQGRAGTVTAALAKGAAPAGSVPAAPPAVRIAAVRPAGAVEALPKPLLARLNKEGGCDELYEGVEDRPKPETFALGGGKTLVLLPCGSGAYNFDSHAFILAKGKAVEAEFDLSSGEGDGNVVVNASWEKGVLSSYYKGRGIGDCGLGARYVWDGARFRLIEMRQMDECRGSAHWLTTWRAEPVFR